MGICALWLVQAMVGGNANNGSNCGPSYLNNTTVSNSNSNYGARLTNPTNQNNHEITY